MSPLTSYTTVTDDTISVPHQMPSLVFVVLTGVSGTIALLLSLLYAYIYFTKIKPRARGLTEDRINYSTKDSGTQYGTQVDRDANERIPIKTHPLLFLAYLSRSKTSDLPNNQGASTSSKRF